MPGAYTKAEHLASEVFKRKADGQTNQKSVGSFWFND